METFEELQTRHRREQKDLQGRITQKKKGATKKTRKGVNTECDELERKLKEKHAQEIAALDGDAVPDVNDVPELEEDPAKDEDDAEPNGLAEQLENTAIGDAPASDAGQPKKRNRQKERLARRAAEQEAAIEEAKREAANMPDPKAVERAVLEREFKAQGLTEKNIPPDGHCLFNAVADQLSQVGIPLGVDLDTELKDRYKIVRKAAAGYIEGHPDEFVAWLDEPLEDYVHKIRDTAEWGGHLELLALAKTYKVEICVIQNGTTQRIEPGLGEKEPDKIWLAYYRHGFGLGEHYNSLRKAP